MNGGTQAQSIAYSLDEGTTWTTYDAANPVIPLPPVPYQDQWRDFRDPFVFWHAASSKWVSIISLAQLRKILVYTSPNLKDWTYISEYGPVSGVTGVLECPSLIELPLDGNEANLKWVLQIGVNPGGPPGTTGSGNLYQVGIFDGTTFTLDSGVTPSSPTSTTTTPPIATTSPASGNITFETFEYTDTYASHGWTVTGDLSGAAPAQGTLGGQQQVSGYVGNRLLNTFLAFDSTTGTFTSPSFVISHKNINFLIGGGNAPGQECINLKIQGQVVRTATGLNDERLLPQSWDVSNLIGQTAVLEIVDSSTGSWGHILIDQITFTDPPSASGPAPNTAALWSFNSTGSYADLGWTATGDLVGAGPAQGTLGGQQIVTGYSGNFVNTFINVDTTTGTLTSPPFIITQKQISFLIGGGNLPGQECINLKIQGQVVRTATGANQEMLIPQNWDVSDLIGQSAVIEIVDSSTGGWGHILIDEITFSNASPAVSLSRWVDFGPDYYAAVPFNGLPATNKVGIAWMSNWQYASSVPTSLWRGGLTIPRKLSLKTIDDRATLVQQPVADWTSLETVSDYTNSWDTVAEGTQTLPLSGKALDITITFSDRSSASTSPQFGLILRATSDLGQQTRVGYDFGTKRLFVDRTKSGNVGFDGTFSNTYYAPLTPAKNGQVTLRILLDWSSVEVFGGDGQATLTTQIFPNDNGVDISLFSTGGGTNVVGITAKSVGSIYNTSPNPSSSTRLSTSSSFVTSIISSTSFSTSSSSTLSTSSQSSVNISTGTMITTATISTTSRTTTRASPTPTGPYDFRPTYHFVPDQNWMNEPNGLIKIGSTWHLFFQHNPTGNFWGNMSWGHATSTDLINWDHKPVAISSADGIQAFTGTSYYDPTNLSGLGTSANPPYLAFYTGYFPSSGVQDQRLAYSLDQGTTWTKYSGNPIISQGQESPHDVTKGLEARDPKVFFHNPTGKWVMIVAHGGQNKVTFWTSPDAKSWTWTSDFTSADVPGLSSAITGWEVPDFFELQIDGTTTKKWVLIVTPANGSPATGNGVFGLTGSFDGTVFTADPIDPSTLWLDYGRDFDGALSWENVPASDGRKIIAAIANSYGGNPPTNTWKGMLSFPRTIKLKQLNGKLQFLQLPVSELDAVGTPLTAITNQALAPGQSLLTALHGKALDIRLDFTPAAGSTLTLAVRKGGNEQTLIKYSQSRNELSVDRNASGNTGYDPAAGGVHVAALQADSNGVVHVRILVDECSVEVYGGEGESVISDLIFPSASSDGLSLTTDGGNVVVQSVEVRAITPWI